jgi:hypothetical protein
MKKLLLYFGMIWATVVVAVVLSVIGALGWYVWQLHPWVPNGQVFALGYWRFGDCEFQVWQRKNNSVVEPFSDGLFVRRGTNQWRAFCFDIQDSYSPKVRLQQDGAQVVVYRDGERRGVYDMALQTFQRHDQPYAPAYIIGEPPGDWLIR